MARAKPALAGVLTLATVGLLQAGTARAAGAVAQAGQPTAAETASAGPSAASSAGPSAGRWQGDATLSTCAAVGAARAVFPQDKPTRATGAGAIVWSDSSACAGGAGTIVSAIGRADAPGAPYRARAPDGAKLSLRPPLALAAAPHGEIAIAGSSPPATSDGGQLVQGSAGGPFSTLGTIAGAASQSALSTGYLGDLAAASATGGGSGRAGVRVDVERYFARALSASRIVPAQAGAVRALTVGLDFRTDAIAAWCQGGSLYAHDLPASGRPQPTQRLANVAPATQLAVLISDDNRAIVAWADERSGSTSVYLDASAGGVSFGTPQLLEHFANAGGLHSPVASPRLVRLSSESVLIAWNGAEQGHWVVRVAAIDPHGLGKIDTVSAPGEDALLSDLAAGPDGEALALWMAPQRAPDGSLDTAAQALVAARGIDAAPATAIFSAGEQVAPDGPNSKASLAFDPASDRALALWRGAGGGVRYAIRASSAH